MKAVTVILILTLSLPAFARGKCRQEIDEICGDKRGNRQAMRQCIKENMSQLSEECQTRIKERKGKRDGPKERE